MLASSSTYVQLAGHYALGAAPAAASRQGTGLFAAVAGIDECCSMYNTSISLATASALSLLEKRLKGALLDILKQPGRKQDLVLCASCC